MNAEASDLIARRPARGETLSIARYALASLGTQMVLATATAFLPAMLDREGARGATLATLLAIPPILGAVAQPIACVKSEGSNGRSRRPAFVAIGALACAAALAILGRATSLSAAALGVVAVFIAFNAYAGPYRASLDEEIERADQPLATGFSAAFKGVGTLLAFTAGAAMLARSASGPFDLVAVIVVATAWITASGLKGRRIVHAARARGLRTAAALAKHASPELVRTLAAHFLGWVALHSVFAFLVLFLTHDLAGASATGTAASRAATSDAAKMLGVFAASAMIAAVPIGRLAQRAGKRRVLSAGLLLLLAGVAGTAFSKSAGGLVPLLILGGVGFAVVQVVPFPLVNELAPVGQASAVAAAFYALIEIAQLVALAVSALLIQATDTYRAPLVFAACVIAVAAALLPRRFGAT